MLPVHTGNDCLDRIAADIELRRKPSKCHPSRAVSLSNLNNLIGGKFGVAVSFPLRAVRSVAALAHHVVSVVLRCAKEKVSRVYAHAIVAPMANQHPFWNLPIVNKPRYSWGQPKLSVSKQHFAGTELPVAACCSRPVPAFVWSGFVHLRPESFLNSFRLGAAHNTWMGHSVGSPTFIHQDEAGKPSCNPSESGCNGFSAMAQLKI